MNFDEFNRPTKAKKKPASKQKSSQVDPMLAAWGIDIDDSKAKLSVSSKSTKTKKPHKLDEGAGDQYLDRGTIIGHIHPGSDHTATNHQRSFDNIAQTKSKQSSRDVESSSDSEGDDDSLLASLSALGLRMEPSKQCDVSGASAGVKSGVAEDDPSQTLYHDDEDEDENEDKCHHSGDIDMATLLLDDPDVHIPHPQSSTSTSSSPSPSQSRATSVFMPVPPRVAHNSDGDGDYRHLQCTAAEDAYVSSLSRVAAQCMQSYNSTQTNTHISHYLDQVLSALHEVAVTVQGGYRHTRVGSGEDGVGVCVVDREDEGVCVSEEAKYMQAHKTHMRRYRDKRRIASSSSSSSESTTDSSVSVIGGDFADTHEHSVVNPMLSSAPSGHVNIYNYKAKLRKHPVAVVVSGDSDDDGESRLGREMLDEEEEEDSVHGHDGITINDDDDDVTALNKALIMHKQRQQLQQQQQQLLRLKTDQTTTTTTAKTIVEEEEEVPSIPTKSTHVVNLTLSTPYSLSLIQPHASLRPHVVSTPAGLLTVTVSLLHQPLSLSPDTHRVVVSNLSSLAKPLLKLLFHRSEGVRERVASCVWQLSVLLGGDVEMTVAEVHVLIRDAIKHIQPSIDQSTDTLTDMCGRVRVLLTHAYLHLCASSYRHSYALTHDVRTRVGGQDVDLPSSLCRACYQPHTDTHTPLMCRPLPRSCSEWVCSRRAITHARKHLANPNTHTSTGVCDDDEDVDSALQSLSSVGREGSLAALLPLLMPVLVLALVKKGTRVATDEHDEGMDVDVDGGNDGDSDGAANTPQHDSTESSLAVVKTLLPVLALVLQKCSPPQLSSYIGDLIMIITSITTNNITQATHVSQQKPKPSRDAVMFDANTVVFFLQRVVTPLALTFTHTLAPVTPALVRSLLPALAHKAWKVRVAAVDTVEVLVHCGGSDCIRNLAAFREHNIIDVKEFYHGTNRVNYFSALSQDPSPRVRRRVGMMVAGLLQCLPDRHDYETLLTPYLFAAVCDSGHGGVSVGVGVEDTYAADASDVCVWMFERVCVSHQEDPAFNIQQHAQSYEASIYHSGTYSRTLLPLHPLLSTAPLPGAIALGSKFLPRLLPALLGELSDWRHSTQSNSIRMVMLLLELCGGGCNQWCEPLTKSLSQVVSSWTHHRDKKRSQWMPTSVSCGDGDGHDQQTVHDVSYWLLSVLSAHTPTLTPPSHTTSLAHDAVTFALLLLGRHSRPLSLWPSLLRGIGGDVKELFPRFNQPLHRVAQHTLTDLAVQGSQVSTSLLMSSVCVVGAPVTSQLVWLSMLLQHLQYPLITHNTQHTTAAALASVVRSTTSLFSLPSVSVALAEAVCVLGAQQWVSAVTYTHTPVTSTSIVHKDQTTTLFAIDQHSTRTVHGDREHGDYELPCIGSVCVESHTVSLSWVLSCLYHSLFIVYANALAQCRANQHALIIPSQPNSTRTVSLVAHTHNTFTKAQTKLPNVPVPSSSLSLFDVYHSLATVSTVSHLLRRQCAAFPNAQHWDVSSTLMDAIRGDTTPIATVTAVNVYSAVITVAVDSVLNNTNANTNTQDELPFTPTWSPQAWTALAQQCFEALVTASEDPSVHRDVQALAGYTVAVLADDISRMQNKHT